MTRGYQSEGLARSQFASMSSQDVAAAQGSALTGYAGATETRQAEIPGLLQRLDNRVAQLAEALGTLDHRLTGNIARSSPPMPAGDNKNQIKAATQTGLGSQLDGLVEAVEMMTHRARDLAERLEV